MFSPSRSTVVRCAAFLLLAGSVVHAQLSRIRGPVDDTSLVALHGNTHPLARRDLDRGPAPGDLRTERMLLFLSRSSEQQLALDKLLVAQHDPASPDYLHWLSPVEFGQRFGPTESDIAAVTDWLRLQGFTVAHPSAGRSTIEFSGTAAHIQQAFHTAIHKYAINGQEYWANDQDPRIPAALVSLVGGVVSLNNFPQTRQSHRLGSFSRHSDGSVNPQFTVGSGSSTYYALAPADFATIYNSAPLLQAGNNGSGQTIAVLARSNVHLSDISNFRSVFGLGPGNTSVVLDGPDPGIVSGDEGESVLDLEWASAVAPSATVVLVAAESTVTTSGLELAALHVIDNNMAGVMNLSYGACESMLGNTGNQFIQSLWQQAAAQGITVVVSAGDAGSAGCDYQGLGILADSGIAVNGLASTPYNVAIGGTDFNDAGSQATYWGSTNNSTTHASALSYIPEVTWNSTCAANASVGNLDLCPAMPSSGSPPSSSGLNVLAASGGASSCTVSTSSGGSTQCQSGTPKPSWQTGTGVPADGVRDIPDISLFSAIRSSSQSFYAVCQSDIPNVGPVCYSTSNPSFVGVGGTSVAAAAFSGIVALAQQKAGARLGNINYFLYNLAAQPGASCTSSASPGGSCIFNDVVSGNISVPCKAGSPDCSATSGTATGVLVTSQSPAYSATAGYDLATGLGSINITNLVNGIANAIKSAAPTTIALTLNGATTAVTAQHGSSISVGVTVTPSASAGTVSLVGKSGDLGSAALNAGVANWNSRLFPGGSYTVKAHYPGDATHAASDSNGINVTISPEPSQTFVNLVTFGATGTSFSANTAAYGSPYILRADVTDAAATASSATGVSSACSTLISTCPTGTLTIKANGSLLDGGTFPLNSLGFVEDHPIQLPGGSFSIVASYPGDASYSASTGSTTVTITKAPTTLTAGTAVVSPLQYGTQSQINAVLSTHSSGVAPTGTYNFFDNGSPAGTNVKQNYQDARPGAGSTSAQVTYYGWYIPSLLGSHTLYAQYSGDGNYLPSDSSASPFTVTVGKAGTWFSSYGMSTNVAIPAVPVTFTVYVGTTSVLAQPTGNVTFYDNGTPITATVTYSGGPGSGTVGGSASLQAKLITTFATGAHTITAAYSGDTNYNALASQSLGTLNVYDKLPVTVTVVPELNPTAVNYTMNLKATVGGPTYPGAPAVSGTVVFYDNGQPLSGTVAYTIYAGTFTATLPYKFTATGSHNITASYSGDTTYAAGTSAAVALSVVDKLPTTTNANGNGGLVNLAVGLSAYVQGTPGYVGSVMGGTVTFSDGGVPLQGNVQLSPSPGYLIANMTYTFTTAGKHNITAQYSGDANYASSTSNVAVWDILGPLAVRLQNNNLIMPSTGGSGTVTLRLINTTSSAMTVALSCTPDSVAATCSPSVPSLNVAANTTMGPSVTYTVPKLGAAARRPMPFAFPFVFAAALAGLPLVRRKKRTLLLALMLITLLVALVSCGGGGGSSSSSFTSGVTGTSGATSKTYNFTVTATSGSNTDSQVLTVTVQ